MSRPLPQQLALAAVATLALAACADRPGGATAPTLDAVDASAALGRSLTAGAVYTTTNAAGDNAVIAWPRASDGTLGAARYVPTGGQGDGAGLGSQGAIVLTDDGRWLLAVNAGSNDVSVFRVRPHGLELRDVEPSGGQRPVSIAVHQNLVYVVNAAGTANVSGFGLHDGDLQPLPGSTRMLSAPGAAPAQASFDPSGRVLLVTEKATNQLTTFVVQADGALGTRTSVTSATPTPFGFAFDRFGNAVVSEAAGGAPGASVVSTYAIGRDGSITPISPSVGTLQAAACWVLISQDGRVALTTNTADGTISSFDLGPSGTATLRESVAGVSGAGSSPIDMAASRDGRFAYVLAPGMSAVRGYTFGTDAALDGLGALGAVPATAYGLAAN